MVHDLDLLGPRPEARERVDEPLEPIVGLDDLLRCALGERVRLVVEDERARPVTVKNVKAAVQQHTVVLERERPLGRRPCEIRDPPRQLGFAVRGDEERDPVELLRGDTRIPRPHVLDPGRDGCGKIDELEQPVHRVADLGRRQPAGTATRGGRHLAHPGHTLGVITVRAALEERQGAVGQPAHLVQRRQGNGRDRRQRRGQRRQRRLADLAEQRELSWLDGNLELWQRDRLSHRNGVRARPVEPQQQPGAVALELDRSRSGLLELRVGVEPAEHPADRRRLVGAAVAVDRARDDQPVDRTGHRNVVEAQPLGLLLRLARRLHVLVGVRGRPLPGRRVGDPEPEAAVGKAQDLVAAGRAPVAAGIRDDDDLELEPLRGMDRQQADRVGPLLLGHSVALRRANRLLLGDEPDETLDVGAAQLLVRACKPRELPQVRVAATPVPQRQHREVVVVLGDDLLAKPLEREPGGHLRQTLVALLERQQQPRVAFVEAGGERALDAGEDRPLRGRAPDQHERVVRDADERRGEHGQQRLVVVAVVQQTQIAEQVNDLLLAEVTASRRAVGRQPGGAQLLLVPLGIGARSEEQHDLARSRGAGVDELADAVRDVLRLRAAPVDAGVGPGCLVGDEQLDRRAEDGIGELARRGERLELGTEVGAEEVVDDREHLGPRAVIPRQRQQRRGPLAPLAKDGDVRVAEAVDRLELVTDEEELARSRVARQQIDNITLKRVRVLELVHHDRAEAELLLLADRLVVAQQRARLELEVLEVERRLAVLRRLVRDGETREELLEQLAVASGERIESRLLDGLPRLLVTGGPFATRPQRAEVEQPLGPLLGVRQLDRAGGGGTCGVGRARVGGEPTCSLA